MTLMRVLANRKRKIYILLLLLSLLVSVTFLVTKNESTKGPQYPRIVEGMLDLTDWDFVQDGAVYLNGDWAFHWNELLVDQSVWEKSNAASNLVSVPGVWNSYLIDGNRLPGQGFATYQLKINMPENHEQMALKILSMSTAYKVIVNGEVIAANGVVGTDAKKSSGQLRPQVAFLPEGIRDYEVSVQVSNYIYDRGGMWYPVIIGGREQILKMQTIGVGQDLLLAGSMLILGLYHIVIYLLRRLYISDLYFGVGCLLVSLRAIFTGETFIVNLFPNLTISLSVFVEYMTYYWGMFFFALFITTFYQKDTSAIFIKIHFWLTVLFSFIVIVFPMSIYTATLNGYHAVVLASCIYLITVLIRAALHHETGALILIFCTLFFLLTVVHDILYNAAVIHFIPRQIVPAGIFVFVFSYAFISALRYSNAYNTIQDMSHRLQSVDRLKDEFLAKTSHELKTPLHGILNISQLMIEGTTGKLNRTQQESLEIVVSTTRRLTHLINDILDFSRLKHMDSILHQNPVNIYTAINSSVDVFRHFIVGKPIRLMSRLEENLPSAWADENRLMQILFNLIGNAIKFTEHGEIAISAILRGETLVISVKDTGIGIPEEKLEIIFQSYEQAGTSSDMKYGGTGLGLGISKKLVELHGGDMWVESKIGSGSTFFFTLPISKKEVSSEEVPQREEQASLYDFVELLPPPVAVTSTSSLADSRFTILAVDDEMANLFVLKHTFSNSEFRLLTATSGVEALNLIGQGHKIDLVILDVMMPGMSGLEVCRTIRVTHSISELPILLVTVQNSQFDIQAGFEAGASDYLTKPFELTELRARVGTLLELKKSINELMKSEMDFLQAQIKPHFLYNTLNTIVSFCRYDADKAGELLIELSNYLRGSFDFQNRETFVSLEQEIKLVQSYVAIEQARFGEKLSVVFHVTAFGSYRIPSLIIQPIVENAVRHGLLPKRDGGTVTIQVWEQKDYLFIRVKDDGIGIPVDRLRVIEEKRAERVGVGIANINQRLQGFYGCGLEIESEVGQGTSVTINIPQRMEGI